jgi:hypothetical protein
MLKSVTTAIQEQQRKTTRNKVRGPYLILFPTNLTPTTRGYSEFNLNMALFVTTPLEQNKTTHIRATFPEHHWPLSLNYLAGG